jgi:hypothetical protein
MADGKFLGRARSDQVEHLIVLLDDLIEGGKAINRLVREIKSEHRLMNTESFNEITCHDWNESPPPPLDNGLGTMLGLRGN